MKLCSCFVSSLKVTFFFILSLLRQHCSLGKIFASLDVNKIKHIFSVAFFIAQRGSLEKGFEQNSQDIDHLVYSFAQGEGVWQSRRTKEQIQDFGSRPGTPKLALTTEAPWWQRGTSVSSQDGWLSHALGVTHQTSCWGWKLFTLVQTRSQKGKILMWVGHISASRLTWRRN